MINKRFETIDKTDIDSLVFNGVAESRTLEYKDRLPGSSDEEKKEFLSDISAFANASGGVILYGVSEERDGNGKTTGLPKDAKGLLGINADVEIRRLDNILRDGVDPRIPGIQIKAIDGFPDGVVLIVRIPKSWNSPHMVTFKNLSRFFARNSAGKYQLDVAEIRSTFIASESLIERVRQFRSDRIAKILADETPVPLEPDPKIVLHVLPIESFSSPTSIDLSWVDRSSGLRPIYSSNWNRRYNFDGLVTYSSFQLPVAHSYAQIFRNGCIEAVESLLLSPRNGRKVIPSNAYEEELISALQGYLELQTQLELRPPLFILVSLLGVKGYEMGVNSLYPRQQMPIDRDILLVPEVFLDDLTIKVVDILRPVFDSVWQSAGWERCFNYHENGDRKN